MMNATFGINNYLMKNSIALSELFHNINS